MINWKLRLKNKITLSTLILSIIAFIYQICGVLGIIMPISENELTQVIALIINLLAGLGIVVDPTTSGASDSDRAMTYDKPN